MNKQLSGFLIFIALVVGLFFVAKSFNTKVAITEKAMFKQPTQVPKISIESIFQKPNDLSYLDQSKIVTILATGDVIPARGANWPAVTSDDFTYNWKKTAAFLKSGDITLINLESPLTRGCQLQTEGMSFCGNARHIEGIVFAGVDSVSLANNHIGNYGQSGTDETINLLEKNNIGWSGFGHLDIQEKKGVRFGFIAINGVGGAPIDRQAMVNEIKTVKQKVDVLVASIHWGMEYELTPKPSPGVAPDDPREIGKLMIDSGVDLVVGNHPHWVQGVELYRNKLITYAHGNFIFDQTWSQETQEGVVGEYTFYISEPKGQYLEARMVNVKFHPILVDISYQPKFLSAKDGVHILDRMYEATKQISNP